MVNNRKEITQEVIETFLNGHDPQERIVNLEYSYGNEYMTVYYRDENDNKCIGREPFYPFLWAKRDVCLKMCNGDKKYLAKIMKESGIWVKELDCTMKNGETNEDMAKNGYVFMFYATQAMSYQKFLGFFKRTGCPVYAKKQKNKQENSFTNYSVAKKNNNQYICVSPQEQFLISTGKRFFKGYNDYDETLRMIFDLETTGLNIKTDRIVQFGIRFNRPVKYHGKYITFEKIYSVIGNTEEERNISEIECIDWALRVIYTFMPDVITAHNGEVFDWNLIIGACERLGTTLEKLSAPYFNGVGITKDIKDSILKLGGEIEKFNRTKVNGITITDSLHAVRRAQATNSNFLEANLKYSTKFLNLKKENRVYTPGDKISEIWKDLSETYAFNDSNGDWYKYDENSKNGQDKEFKPGKNGDEKFIMYTRNYIKDGYELKTGRYIIERYLLDDLWECDKVEKTLNGADFMLCKFIPVTFQKCCTMGTASQWKLIMLAWSFENNLAIPCPENTGSFTGGLSRLLNVGYKENVAKFDYNSLYPSIILTWGINDATDLMGAMLHMLEYVLTTREKYKGLKKQADKKCEYFKDKKSNGETLTKEEENEYSVAFRDFQINDNQQMVVKKLGNSYFGSLSVGNASIFPWKSQACGERTTCTGRMALRLMISHFNNIGYEPIVGDTDGFDFGLPKDNYIAEQVKTQHSVLSKNYSDEEITSDTLLCIKNNTNGEILNISVNDLYYTYINEDIDILSDNGWVNIKNAVIEKVN